MLLKFCASHRIVFPASIYYRYIDISIYCDIDVGKVGRFCPPLVYHVSTSLRIRFSSDDFLSHLRKKLKKPLPLAGRGAISIGT